MYFSHPIGITHERFNILLSGVRDDSSFITDILARFAGDAELGSYFHLYVFYRDPTLGSLAVNVVTVAGSQGQAKQFATAGC